MLNDNEIKVLNACVEEVMACTNGEFGYTSDLIVIGLSKHQVKGYISQLIQKEMIGIAHDFGQLYIKEKAQEYVDCKNCELNLLGEKK